MLLNRSLQILGALVTGLFFLTAFSPLANLLAYWRAPARVLEPAAAIVVLGQGGIAESGQLTDPSLSLITEGIDLYRQGLAPVLVVSGSPSGPRGTEADARVHIAWASGIPPGAIIVLGVARTTREEALAARATLEPRGVRRIILVTDGSSMARAAGAFQKVGFAVTPSYGVPVLRWGGGPGARLRLMQETLIEILACAYYRLQGWI
jgi:uncharacterized SAM-binding protein YcdF (DUF218 family)